MRRSALAIAALTLVTLLVSSAATASQTPPATQTDQQKQQELEKQKEAEKQKALAKEKEELEKQRAAAKEKEELEKKQKAQEAASGEPEVTSVSNVTRPAEKQVRLRDVLRLQVANLKAWRKDPKNVKIADLPLHLSLAGIQLKNVTAMPTEVNRGDESKDISAFLVKLEPENDKDGVVRKAWVQVLQTAIKRADDDVPAAQKPMRISIGHADAPPFVSNADIELKVFRGYTLLVIPFMLIVGLCIVILARRTPILRDSNGAPNPPYSLAKHQMAVWFVVVLGSYLFIWLVTGFLNSLSNTALTLIGISAATGLAAVAMDDSKRTEAAKARVALLAELEALKKTVNDSATGLLTQLKSTTPGSAAATELSATLTPKLARLQELEAQLVVPPAPIQSNQRWDVDLLSDEKGISFHRLQMVIWTLVLAAVFLRTVYTEILMPDFDATLLGLMGISAGTYIGFKFPEKPA
jgi:hypothetical protein